MLTEAEPLDVGRRMNANIGRVLAIPAASVTNSATSSSRALHVDLASQQVSPGCPDPMGVGPSSHIWLPTVPEADGSSASGLPG